MSRNSIRLLLRLRMVFGRDSISLLRLRVGLGGLLGIGIGWLLLVGLLGLGIGSRLIYGGSSSGSPVVLGLMHVDATGGRGLGFAVVEEGKDCNDVSGWVVKVGWERLTEKDEGDDEEDPY